MEDDIYRLISETPVMRLWRELNWLRMK